MEQLQDSIENLVSAGIRAYIGLLSHGERTRSRQVFLDTLQISALVSGGPSARIHPLLALNGGEPGAGRDRGGRAASCLILLSLRSLLATLLVLKTSPYWSRLPILEDLHQSCCALAEMLDTDEPVEYASGGTAVGLNGHVDAGTGTMHGGRRNNALPAAPDLAEPRVTAGR